MYNATVFEVSNNQIISAFVAEVNDNFKILRSNWISCTGYDGTEAYDMYLRFKAQKKDTKLYVQLDNKLGYINAFKRNFPTMEQLKNPRTNIIEDLGNGYWLQRQDNHIYAWKNSQLLVKANGKVAKYPDTNANKEKARNLCLRGK
jgi:hypothetical protein